MSMAGVKDFRTNIAKTLEPVKNFFRETARGVDNVGGGRFWLVGILLALIALPLDIPKDEVLVLTGFYALAALGLNVVVGLAGLLDLGYVAFFMIGAYTVGIFTESNATAHPAILDPWFVLAIAVAVAAFFGVLLGTPVLRLRGDYLAIVTLGFHEITRKSAKNLEVVNGSRGVVGIPHPDVTMDGAMLKVAGLVLIAAGVALGASAWVNTQRARRSAGQTSQLAYIANLVTLGLVSVLGLVAVYFGLTNMLLTSDPLIIEFGVLEPQEYWFVICIFIVLALYLIQHLKDSRIGRAWEAIREDEVAAASMGIHVVKLKLYAFAIGASTSGLAGWALATKVGFINPNTFPLLNSILVLCAVVIGGIGSSAGALIGAAIVFGLPEFLRALGTNEILGFDVLTGRIAIFGLLLIIMMIFRPGGLVSSARRRAELGGGAGHDIAAEPAGPGAPGIVEA